MSEAKKELIQLDGNIVLNPSDISSLEFEAYSRDYWGQKSPSGTIVTMKSGRKLFIKGETPEEVLKKISKAEVQE